ncbi:MAG: hypothetical protein KJ622_06520 [Alphaproteobacteria bacterium]|nr:hypothetical protein [Alphaproteobacteria bacterium]
MRPPNILIAGLLLAVGLIAAGGWQPAAAAPEGEVRAANPEGELISLAEMSDDELRAAMVKFVENFYLAGEDQSDEQLTVLYAPVVDYFGSRRKSRVAIIRDQKSYYRKWPDRSFLLAPNTLRVERTSGGEPIVEVTFEYLFDNRSAKRRSRGRGVSYLTLDFSVAGGQIIREGGRVLQRYR